MSSTIINSQEEQVKVDIEEAGSQKEGSYRKTQDITLLLD